MNNNNKYDGCSKSVISFETIRALATHALALTEQDWNSLGQGSDPLVAESFLFEDEDDDNEDDNEEGDDGTVRNNHNRNNSNNNNHNKEVLFQRCVDRITALLVVRLVAIQHHNQQYVQQRQKTNDPTNKEHNKSSSNTETDFSTTGICRRALRALSEMPSTLPRQSPHPPPMEEPPTATQTVPPETDEQQDESIKRIQHQHPPHPWPDLTDDLLVQVRRYVVAVLRRYAWTAAPFHNARHAVAVVVSCNKLLDLMTPTTTVTENSIQNGTPGSNTKNDTQGEPQQRQQQQQQTQHRRRRPQTFGLRDDPILLLSLLFAALIHDVQHQGVRNAQLVLENTTVAMMYNDQSVQEHQSLAVAFEEFLKPDYQLLRHALFGKNDTNNALGDSEHTAAYRTFRQTVVSAVLSTDLASPEQSVLTKAKWKEAFEHYQLQQQQQQQHHDDDEESPEAMPAIHHQQQQHSSLLMTPRRGSLTSNMSMPRMLLGSRVHRRGSNWSEVSDVTTDFYSVAGPASPWASQRRASGSNAHGWEDPARRRLSGGGGGNRHHQNYHPRRRMSADGLEQMIHFSPDGSVRRRRQLRHQSDSLLDDNFGAALDFMNIMVEARSSKTLESFADGSVFSVASDSADSFAIMKKRKISIARNPAGAERLSTEKVHKAVFNEDVNEFVPESPYLSRAPSTLGDESVSLVSFAAESIGISQKRLDGAKLTRSREAKPHDEAFLNDQYDRADGVSFHQQLVPANPTQICQDHKEHSKFYSRLEDESSFSLTPPSSDDELEDSNVRSATVKLSKRHAKPTQASETPLSRVRTTRRASTGMVASRFGSLAGQRIEEELPNHSSHRELGCNDVDIRSVPTVDSAKFRKRLGILRSMDISGDSIEIYSRRSSTGGGSTFSLPPVEGNGGRQDVEEFNYLRATAILEVMLRAADVGHFLQSWENMTDWSLRIFMELSLAHEQGRGHDPGPSWYENQIVILDRFLNPLAVQLDESGIFGNRPTFAENVEDIRNKWLLSGFELTEALKADVPKNLASMACDKA